MRVERLSLDGFRNYRQAEFVFSPGLTAIVGANGEGKTNLAEAVAFLATLSSFRGVANDALVAINSPAAIIRAEGERSGRSLLIEIEISSTGRTRAQLNRQRITRNADLLEALRVTVFSPDDLELVKGAPALRRRFMDDLLVALDPRLDRVRSDLERILKQRNMLLKQLGGRLDTDTAATLEVWDERLGSVGSTLGQHRANLVEMLRPEVAVAYESLAGEPSHIELHYRPGWLEDYPAALEASREADLRRGITLEGPHRDEFHLGINQLVARTHASQGEQRTLAIALRMAANRMITDELGVSPILVLDDIFSELDPRRSQALLDSLPPGQTLLTTAGGLPDAAKPETVLHIEAGRVIADHYP